MSSSVICDIVLEANSSSPGRLTATLLHSGGRSGRQFCVEFRSIGLKELQTPDQAGSKRSRFPASRLPFENAQCEGAPKFRR